MQSLSYQRCTQNPPWTRGSYQLPNNRKPRVEGRQSGENITVKPLIFVNKIFAVFVARRKMNRRSNSRREIIFYLVKLQGNNLVQLRWKNLDLLYAGQVMNTRWLKHTRCYRCKWWKCGAFNITDKLTYFAILICK